MRKCKCRLCGKIYSEDKSRADWKGYCTQGCFHAMAKKHGFVKRLEKMQGMSEYSILSRKNLLGSVFAEKAEVNV